MNRIQIRTAVALLASLAAAASAYAGTTTVVGGATKYAREVGATNVVLTLPAQTVTRAMNVVRATNQDFFLKATLSAGAQFATGSLPEDADLALTTAAGGGVTITRISGGLNTNTSVTYFVDITTSFTGLPTFTLTTTGWTIRDTLNTIGTGGTVEMTINTSDTATGITFDAGTDSADWLRGVYGVESATLVSTTAVVDVATGRLNLVPTAPDTALNDNGATLTLTYAAGVLKADGTAYALTEGVDTLALILAGNLSGVFSWTWNPESGGGGTPAVDVISSGEATAGSSTLVLSTAANLAAAVGTRGLRVTVSGSTALSARSLFVSVAHTSASGSRTLVAGETLTTWTLNGTVLVANWANGNSSALSSRLYVFNPTFNPAVVTARAYSLPLSGTSTLLGTAAVANLIGQGGVNLRVAEDILTPMGVALPYTTDGGNLVIELTIEAVGCSGVSQTFSGSFAYGTMPLNVLP